MDEIIIAESQDDGAEYPWLSVDWFNMVGTGAVAVTPETEEATAAPPYIRVAGGYLYIQEAGTWKRVALSTF